MKSIGKFLIWVIWIANLLAALLMLFSAFSPMLVQPTKHPLLSLAGFVFPMLAGLNLLFLLFFLLFRQFKYALLPLVSLLICYNQLHTYLPFNSQVSAKPEGSLKILSYNAMAFGNMLKTDGKNDVLEYLKASDADIICLQEHSLSGNKRQLTQQDVDKALADYKYRAPKPAYGEKNVTGIAIYSKLPILKTERVNLKSKSNGAMAYHIKWGMDTLLVVNCHLESNKLTIQDKEMYEQMIEEHKKEQMKEGMKVLVRKLAEASAIRAPQADSIVSYLHSTPYIYKVVCGDFNDTPISYTHHILTRELKDAFTESGSGLGISYHRNKFLFRIDNILVSEALQVQNCTVDTSIDASDHYPIWSYVEKN